MHHLYLQAFNCSPLWLEVRKITESRLPTALLGLCSGCCVGLKLTKRVDMKLHFQHSGVQGPLCGTHNREGNDKEHIFSMCAFSMSPSHGGWALSSNDLPKLSAGPYLMWKSQWNHSLFLNGCFILLYILAVLMLEPGKFWVRAFKKPSNK